MENPSLVAGIRRTIFIEQQDVVNLVEAFGVEANAGHPAGKHGGDSGKDGGHSADDRDRPKIEEAEQKLEDAGKQLASAKTSSKAAQSGTASLKAQLDAALKAQESLQHGLDDANSRLTASTAKLAIALCRRLAV